ncbi:MAG TPA: LLM class flavin-dependent oxidoreductase [Acidimicrobiales bacterium]|nr:LLM class flavin-dependent oxidoreductase [Acidimicrobiales bacterium]
MRFGTDYYARDMGAYAGTVRACEEAGLELLGHGDSPCLWHDPYVALAVAAEASTTLRLGPMVTNPVTRHPAVTAAAMTSLQELSGGRMVVGIGGGDSAVLNLGRRPAPVDEVVAYATAVRELTAGRPATYHGERLRLRWATDPVRPVPVFLAAEGPKKLGLAGAMADGVIVSNGLTRQVVQDTIATVRQGAVDAGRSPDAVEIWWMVNFQFADTVEDGVASLRWLLAASADHVFRFTLAGKRVPEDQADGLRELMAGYAHGEHAVADGSAHNADLVDRCGLRDWLAQRFAVTGPPEACVDRLREIAGYGATNLLFTQLVPDQIGFLRRLGTEVLPKVR